MKKTPCVTQEDVGYISVCFETSNSLITSLLKFDYESNCTPVRQVVTSINFLCFGLFCVTLFSTS